MGNVAASGSFDDQHENGDGRGGVLAAVLALTGCGTTTGSEAKPTAAGGSTMYEFDTGELESRITAEFVRTQNHVDTTIKFIDCTRPGENGETRCVIDATGFAAYGSLADPDPTTRFNAAVRCSGSSVDGCMLLRLSDG